MKLFFIRHGNPDYARDCLTELGQRQAERAARRIAEEAPARLYTSPQGRARQTAAYAERLLGLTAEPLPWLRELAWGDGRGEPSAADNPWSMAQAVLDAGGSLAEADWRGQGDFPHNLVSADVTERYAALDAFLAEQGYVREGGYYRCARPNADRLALFCHGGVLTAICCHLLGMSFAEGCLRLNFDQTSLTALELDGAPGQLCAPRRLWANEVAFLGELSERRMARG